MYTVYRYRESRLRIQENGTYIIHNFLCICLCTKTSNILHRSWAASNTFQISAGALAYMGHVYDFKVINCDLILGDTGLR